MGKNLTRMHRDNKKIQYGDEALEYSDKDYQITFEALIKIIKGVIGESDIGLLSCGNNQDHILIVVEDGDQKGGGFYDFKTRTAFNLTENWAQLIEDLIEIDKNGLFSEKFYEREKGESNKKDLDLLSEDDWRNCD